MQKLNRFVSIVLLLVIISNMVVVPQAMAARNLQASDPFATLWEHGEVYTTSTAEMLHSSVDLTNILNYLASLPYLDASETSLATAQNLALTSANEAAKALGSAGGLSNELENTLPVLFNLETPDPNEIFWDGAFPTEISDGLGNWNLSQSLIDEAALEVNLKSDTRQNIVTNGLPITTSLYLQSLGLTITETQEIETALGQRGVFQSGLTRQIDQFKASQFEFATVRTQALIIYAQLLTRQIAVRRAAGITAQTPEQADLDAIADDQLRLLIHVGHLNAQWGATPDLEKGEGDWWFIERYAGSAANRIAKLLIKTQNPGLLVDYFVIKQMETTAITALAGDPAYARDELTRLAELLTIAIGGEQAQGLISPLLDSQPDLIAQFGPDWLRRYWQVPIDPVAQAYARQRVAGLASPLIQGQGGVIPELDETNNRVELLFNASPGSDYDPLDADIILQMQDLLGSLGNNPVLNFLWGVLGGQTDYPMAIVINALLSMIPAVGLAFDVIGLFDPSNFVKFMSLVGIITSLGEVTIVLPVVGQVSGPGSFVGDKAIAVTKATYKILRLAATPLVKVVDKLPFKQAAQFGIGLITVLVERGIKKFGANDSIWTDAVRLLDELGLLITEIWNAATGLATVLGADGLLKYGDSEGGMLLGRIFHLGDDATDAALKGNADIIARIGDDLADAAADLSDEAAEGVGKLVNNIGEANTRRLLESFPCPSGVAQVRYTRSLGLASPLIQTEQCLDDGLAWLAKEASQEAFDAFVDLVSVIGFPKAAKVFEYDIVARTNILETIANSPTVFNKNQAAQLVGWYGDDALELFARYTDDGLDALATYGQDAINLLQKYGDDPLRGDFVGPYLQNIRSAQAFDLTKITLKQGFEVSYYAQVYKVDIYVAGRLSDTAAEAALRNQAATELIPLRDGYINGSISRPQELIDAIEEFSHVPEKEIITVWAQREIGKKYGFDWFQVKVSSGKPEVDAFIPISQWENLDGLQQTTLRELIGHGFELPNLDVDFYQLLPHQGDEWKISVGGVNPKTVPPPGSAKFGQDSTIQHELLGGL